MSVRRLADDIVQPAAFAFSNENLKWAENKIAEYPVGRQQSAVIPLLMRAQDQEGWVSRAAIERVGDMLGMPYIRVLEVATFYTQFQLQPVGTLAHIQVCGTTPCMLRGAEDIRAVCQRRINHEPHHTNADGTLSWEEVECLGACVNAPMVAIFHDTYEDLTPERMEEIIDAFASGKGDTIKPGPQTARQFAAAASGQTTLTEAPTATRTYKPFPPPPPPADAAPAPAPQPAPAKAQEPTTPGRKSEVSVEAAPAIKGPAPGAPKVSVARAEAARKAADRAAKADGTPNVAMREGATGAESPAGKINAGKTDTKAKRAPATISASSPATDAGAPAPLFAAPAGQKDDLKLISGVGPVLEGRLNAIGIVTWAQVAALKKADIEKLEAGLGFPGRVARDEWIRQAKALAKGGVDEYRKVFGKEPR